MEAISLDIHFICFRGLCKGILQVKEQVLIQAFYLQVALNK